MKTYVSRVICARHNFTATVGAAVEFALDYYECPACVADEDAERERYAALREQMSQCPMCIAGGDCYRHGFEDEPPEDERTPDERLRDALMGSIRNGHRFWTPGTVSGWFGIVIESPNFCEYGNPPF